MLQNVNNGMSDPRFFLYSGHDLGPIMPLLSAFNAWNGTWATYAAMLTIELLDMPQSTVPSVRMVYNGEVKQLPGCAAALCTLQVRDRYPRPIERTIGRSGDRVLRWCVSLFGLSVI